MNEYKIIKDDQLLPAAPDLVAEMFAHMDSEEQAKFFNHVGEIASQWIFPEMQLQYLTDEPGLTLCGRRVMQGIGEYSHWGVLADLERS